PTTTSAITPTAFSRGTDSSKHFTEYSVPTPQGGPYSIVVGPDRNLWFTEYDSSRIGRITTDGAITEYPLPTPNSAPDRIIVGPDGALWFAEAIGNKIGRITIDGTITEYP